MILRELTILDKERYEEYISAWTNEERIVPHSTNNTVYDGYEDMLRQYAELKQQPPAGYVPAVTLYLFNKQTIVGAVNIRMQLNDWLRNIGGHVGYGVHPNYRGRGYAQIMLDEAVRYLSTFGVHEILVTCAESNIASKRTIEKCGGRPLKSYHAEGEDEPKLRFQIINTL